MSATPITLVLGNFSDTDLRRIRVGSRQVDLVVIDDIDLITALSENELKEFKYRMDTSQTVLDMTIQTSLMSILRKRLVTRADGKLNYEVMKCYVTSDAKHRLDNMQIEYGLDVLKLMLQLCAVQEHEVPCYVHTNGQIVPLDPIRA